MAYFTEYQTLAAVAEDYGVDIDEQDMWDTVHSISDLASPIYYNDIRRVWEEYGCPDPDEDLTQPGLDIHSLMQSAIYSAMAEELSAFGDFTA